MFRLSGFELRNFRSIGERPVVIYPLKKCNILVGQNNAGKSNVLRAIQRISERHRKNQLSLEDLDLHKRSKEKPFIYKLFF